MASHLHAAVWIDHHEARIFHVDPEKFDEATVQSPHHHIHRHPKGAAEGHEHPQDETHYFREVAQALADAGGILLLGPSTAKLHFLRYLHDHDRVLAGKILGIETVDHPTDAQLVAYLKHYFRVPDLRVR